MTHMDAFSAGSFVGVVLGAVLGILLAETPDEALRAESKKLVESAAELILTCEQVHAEYVRLARGITLLLPDTVTP